MDNVPTATIASSCRLLLAKHKQLGPERSLPVAPLTTSTRPAASRPTTSCICEEAGSRCRASRIDAMRGLRAAASASAASLLLSASMSILGPLRCEQKAHAAFNASTWGPWTASDALHICCAFSN